MGIDSIWASVILSASNATLSIDLITNRSSVKRVFHASRTPSTSGSLLIEIQIASRLPRKNKNQFSLFPLSPDSMFRGNEFSLLSTLFACITFGKQFSGELKSLRLRSCRSERESRVASFYVI